MMLPGSGNIFQSIEMIERGILRKINLKKDEKRVHFHLVSSSEGSDSGVSWRRPAVIVTIKSQHRPVGNSISVFA